MACDHGDRIAAVASLAGDTWKDQSHCTTKSPVPVLQIQGDADAVVAYGGGAFGTNAYPGSKDTLADWAAKNACTGTLTATGQTYDLDTVLAGAETNAEAYTGCPGSVAVELWTIRGGSHTPSFQTDPTKMITWGEHLWTWLSAHTK
jgi:polyhydroxybutyrate depolymerase